MDRKLSKQLKSYLIESLALPPAEMTPDKGAIVPSGWVAFHRRFTDCSVFLLLITATNENKFSIEVGWSRDHIFPSFALVDDPKVDLRLSSTDKFRFRLCALWEPERDLWWHIVENIPGAKLEALGYRPCVFTGNVEAAVIDVIEKFERFAIPFLRTTIEAYTPEE